MPTRLRSLVAAALASALVAGCSPGADEPAGEQDAPGPSSDELLEQDQDREVGPEEDDPGEVEVSFGVPPLLGGEDGIDHWDETRVELGDEPRIVDAKVADTGARRRQGLMRVPELPEGVGMLFVFDDLRTGGFWMKDTLVPLDIAYLADGEVAAILQMDPCEADPCPTYDAGVTYDAALEVRQGWFAEAGIEEGDEVTWTEPVPVDGP